MLMDRAELKIYVENSVPYWGWLPLLMIVRNRRTKCIPIWRFCTNPLLTSSKSTKKRPGKDYLFDVCLCDGHYCDGVVKVRAKDEDDAYETALEYVCRRLYKALPESDIKVQVDLKDGNTEVCNDF